MKFRKTLREIVLMGALALGNTGCATNPDWQYSYDGKIGEDLVSSTQFYSLFFPNESRINVVKKDGRTLYYCDIESDLKLDFVIITDESGKETKYTPDNVIGETVLKEAQKQQKILIYLI